MEAGTAVPVDAAMGEAVSMAVCVVDGVVAATGAALRAMATVVLATAATVGVLRVELATAEAA